MRVKENLEFKTKWIQWVLDFIQLDLDSLSKSKLRGLSVEAGYFISDAFVTDTFEVFLSYGCFDKLPEIQIGNFDETALKQLRMQDHCEATDEEMETVISEALPVLPNIQTALRDFLKEAEATALLLKPHELQALPYGGPVGFSITGWTPTNGFETHYGVFLPDTENRLQYGRDLHWINMSFPKSFGSTQGEWAILNLAKLMNGDRINAINRCAGCARYFYNPSEREKMYCNSSCASRSIAHKKYEELKKHSKKYQAHLKKYRKYSSDRYERLRKMQCGPNVKIQKRRGKERRINHGSLQTGRKLLD